MDLEVILGEWGKRVIDADIDFFHETAESEPMMKVPLKLLVCNWTWLALLLVR